MTITSTESLTSNHDSVAGLATAMAPAIFDEQQRDHLVARHLGLVRKVCARFRNSGEPMEDLVQVGSVGLLKAVAKYDPELGSNFAAYAVPVITGEVKNYFRDHGWAVKIPRKLQTQRLAVGRAVDILNQDLGRSPTIQEIVEATGFSEDEVSQTFEEVKLSCDGPQAVVYKTAWLDCVKAVWSEVLTRIEEPGAGQAGR